MQGLYLLILIKLAIGKTLEADKESTKNLFQDTYHGSPKSALSQENVSIVPYISSLTINSPNISPTKSNTASTNSNSPNPPDDDSSSSSSEDDEAAVNRITPKTFTTSNGQVYEGNNFQESLKTIDVTSYKNIGAEEASIEEFGKKNIVIPHGKKEEETSSSDDSSSDDESNGADIKDVSAKEKKSKGYGSKNIIIPHGHSDSQSNVVMHTFDEFKTLFLSKFRTVDLNKSHPKSDENKSYKKLAIYISFGLFAFIFISVLGWNFYKRTPSRSGYSRIVLD